MNQQRDLLSLCGGRHSWSNWREKVTVSGDIMQSHSCSHFPLQSGCRWLWKCTSPAQTHLSLIFPRGGLKGSRNPLCPQLTSGSFYPNLVTFRCSTIPDGTAHPSGWLNSGSVSLFSWLTHHSQLPVQVYICITCLRRCSSLLTGCPHPLCAPIPFSPQQLE